MRVCEVLLRKVVVVRTQCSQSTAAAAACGAFNRLRRRAILSTDPQYLGVRPPGGSLRRDAYVRGLQGSH